MQEQELWRRIDENHKSIVGISEIPERIQKLFLTAHDLIPIEHVRMQVAFQKFTNNAVSKTVNLKREATEKDVEEVYKAAIKLGAKGVTIYRDGSKDLQILNLSESKKEDSKELKIEKRKRGVDFGTKSAYYCMDTGQGPLHIHVNYDEEGPISVFANITPIGTEVSGLTTALGILISKYLELGGDAVRLLKHLNSIKGDKPYGLGPKRVDSIPHGISKVLREHLIKTNKIPGLSFSTVNQEQGQTTLVKPHEQKPIVSGLIQPQGIGLVMSSNLYCPKCYSSNVEIVSGCTKPTCFDCGYSECS
jgi:ribonucleoside-diphosphate reductase alpha chain